MSHQSYRAESRRDWGVNSEHGPLTREQVSLGALLRIADATELMAKRHTELIAERDQSDHWYRHERNRRQTAERQLAAARGQITKLKKRLAQAQTQAFGDDPDNHKLPIGCARSHPHENMNEECQRKTVEASKSFKEETKS
jgi:hypothetical protein